MFEDIKNVMISARLAHLLPQSTWKDQHGNEVNNISDSFACKVCASLDLPKLCDGQSKW